MTARDLRLGVAVAAVAALAVLARIPLLFDRYDVAFAPDSGLYVHLADRLLAGLHYPTDYRSPGYPGFIALAHALPGRIEDMTILLQHALGVGIAAAVTAIGWRHFGRVAGVAAGVVAALTPVLMNVEHDVLPDTAFCAVVLGAALVLAGAVIRRPVSYRLLIAAGVLFGLSAYVKPNGQVFVLAAVIPLAFATRSVRQTIVGSLVLAAAVLATVMPWIVRNGIEYDHLSMTAQGGDALYLRAFDQDGLPIPTDTPEGVLAERVRARLVAQAPPGEITGTYSEVAQALVRRRGMTFSEAVGVEGRLARTAILRHPVTYATGTVRNVVLLWGLSSHPARPITRMEQKLTPDEFPRPVALALWGAGGAVHLAWLVCSFGGLAIVALFITGTRESRIFAVTLASIWVIVMIGTALFNSPAHRFAAQVLPLYLILGSAGAVATGRALQQRLAQRAAVSGRGRASGPSS